MTSSSLAHRLSRLRSALRRRLVRTPGAVATIAGAQLLATSLWFSANSEAARLIQLWHAPAQAAGWMSSAVQLGFIVGTLGLSLGGLADRFAASSMFVLSAVAGAAINGWLALLPGSLASGLINRGLLGICLAGIYPLGMKLMVTWAPDRAGSALAQLVAMLTLGTAMPLVLHVLGAGLSWRWVLAGASWLALAAACTMAVLGDGPHAVAPRRSAPRERTSVGARFTVGLQAFRIRGVRRAAFGYFGHMWELYAFWVAVPILVQRSGIASGATARWVWLIAAGIIAMGAVGCLIGGALSRRFGSHRIAAAALAASACCCAAFAVAWPSRHHGLLLGLLLAWGATVVADSPQFSAATALACPKTLLGSALALQNAIGFGITVVAIPLITSALLRFGLDATWLLLPGPLLGLAGFIPALRNTAPEIVPAPRPTKF